MKKILSFVTVLLLVVTLSACTESGLNDQLIETMNSQEGLASLSYLSAGFLDVKAATPEIGVITKLSFTEETETEVEGQLDDINVYLDKLKVFIENGTDNFGNVVEETSDREEFVNKLTITVNEETYILYYNVDPLTNEIHGIFIIGDVEYEIAAYNTLEDSEEFENEHKGENSEGGNVPDGEAGSTKDKEQTANQDGEKSNDEAEDDEDDDADDDPDDEADEVETDGEEPDDDTDEEENEQKMVLIARNGEDFIKITYKIELEEDESTTKFKIEKNIAGVEDEIELKISQEDDEFKIDIKDGENEYTFKRETEDEGVQYKLDYEVNGVKGSVKILETTDADGNVTYTYKIKEKGYEKEIDRDEPESEGEHEDEDEENNEA